MCDTVDAHLSGTIYVFEVTGQRHIVGVHTVYDEGEFDKGGHFIPNDDHICPECRP